MSTADPYILAAEKLESIGDHVGTQPFAPPSASFFAHHNIDIVDETEHPHPHRAILETLAGQAPAEEQPNFRPPPDIEKWPAAGQCSARQWAASLVDYAPYYKTAVGKLDMRGLPATPVKLVHLPCPDDEWMRRLYWAVWDGLHAWRPPCVFVLGSECHHPYCDEIVAGCIVPVRSTLAADEPLHPGEFYCILTLLHRLVTCKTSCNGSVTVVAVTDEGDIRIHEASVHVPTTDDMEPSVRIKKRLVLNTAELKNSSEGAEDVSARDKWLDVMSYICLTYQENMPPAEVNVQLLHYAEALELENMNATMVENSAKIGKRGEVKNGDIGEDDQTEKKDADVADPNYNTIISECGQTEDIDVAKPEHTSFGETGQAENIDPGAPGTDAKSIDPPADKASRALRANAPRKPLGARDSNGTVG